MGDFSIRSAAESAADLLTTYFGQFVAVLSSPASAFRQAFRSQGPSSTQRLRSALAYSITSILIGFCVARFLSLPKSPEAVDPETAIAVLFIWILTSVILHPALRLFRAKGSIESTVVVFLFVVSTLHLIFIPLLTVVGRLVTQTRVTLTYDYVVYFGEPWNREGDSDSWGEIKTESYIKEEEPEKEGTVLPPANLTVTVPSHAPDVHRRQRIKLGDANLESPTRKEEPIVGKDSYGTVLSFWVVYYLTHTVYLSIGLAQAHQMRVWKLLMLATCGPPVLILAAAGMFLLYITLFSG